MKLWSIIVLHHLVLWGFVLTPFFSLVNQPWYITLCLTAFIVRVAYSREPCPLTIAEDVERHKLGMPSTNGKFIKYYYSWIWRKRGN